MKGILAKVFREAALFSTSNEANLWVRISNEGICLHVFGVCYCLFFIIYYLEEDNLDMRTS